MLEEKYKKEAEDKNVEEIQNLKGQFAKLMLMGQEISKAAQVQSQTAKKKQKF